MEIACGNAKVDSVGRLQYSGMMLERCDSISRVCVEGPVMMLCGKLRDTEDMLNDALEELTEVIANEEDEYTSEDIEFAKRGRTKLTLLRFLYRAIQKRRIQSRLEYDESLCSTLDIVYGSLEKLATTTDELVSGLSVSEDLMRLELCIVEILAEGEKLGTAIREPLNRVSDEREAWFDSWLKKLRS